MLPLFKNIRNRRIELNMTQQELADKLGYKSRSAVNKIELGLRDITQTKIEAFAKALNTTPTELMGYVDDYGLPVEDAAETVDLPLIGSIAAGYNELASEDWSGDTVEVPTSYLRGRPLKDFFALRIDGQSMYPLYMDGDIVVIRKADTLDRSGQIGAVIYEHDYATLKKIEYVYGEDWMKLIPVNPEYAPKTITGADLELCRVIGLPVLLIRDVEE